MVLPYENDHIGECEIKKKKRENGFNTSPLGMMFVCQDIFLLYLIPISSQGFPLALMVNYRGLAALKEDLE